jgi:predicted nucleotidyltransferase
MVDQACITKAETSAQKAKELILREIPNEEIISIYIKGSLARQELNADSDVDIVVILKTDKYFPQLYMLSDDSSNTAEFPFQIVGYSLEELKTGVWSKNRSRPTSPISTFVKHLDHLPLMYGVKPGDKLFTRTDLKDLQALLTAMRDKFIPEYNDGKFEFKDLIKQTIWLTEREQRALGHKPDYSWKKLADLVDNDEHIIHKALKLRSQNIISEKDREDFLIELKKYIDYLNITFYSPKHS